MSIVFRRASLAEAKKDILPLLQMEWEEAGLGFGFGIDPDWKQYVSMEDSGMLYVFTARDEGKLVGYIVFLMTPSLHHRGLKNATMDLFYILPEYRKGLLAMKLLKFAEGHLRHDFCKIILLSCFDGSRVGDLYDRLGYRAIETSFVKVM